MVGIGGTVRNLAKMGSGVPTTPSPPRLRAGAARHLADIVDDLASRPMKRRLARGLNPDRADSILGGAVVLLAAMKHVDADRVVISSRGLREGLALGTLDAGPVRPAGPHASRSPRWPRGSRRDARARSGGRRWPRN